MRKLLIVVLTLVTALPVFAALLQISAESTVVGVDDSLILYIKLVDEESGEVLPEDVVLDVSVDIGGFADPEVFFSGLALSQGEAELVYIAPSVPGIATLEFKNADLNVEATYMVQIREKEELALAEKLALKVLEFRGQVALRRAGEEIWNPVKKDDMIYEGDEMLAMKDSYAVLEGKDGILLTVPPETQVLFERLRTDGERMNVSIKVRKGELLSEINRVLTGGSKFMVSAGSVVAGVRGTKFSVEAGENSIVRVFEGVVYAETAGGQIVPISSGNMGVFGTEGFNIASLDRSLDYYEEMLQELESKEEGVTEQPPEEQPAEEEKQPAEEEAGPLEEVDFGPVEKGGVSYMIYSFSIPLSFGPFELGIGINAYQKGDITSPLYYGVPPADPDTPDSTSILSAFNIAWLKFETPAFGIRYGYMDEYTYGLGLLLAGYTSQYARAFDVRLAFGAHQLSVHLPYELLSISPFRLAESSSIYFGNYTFNTGITAGGPYLSVTGVVDMEELSTPSTAIQGGLSVALEQILVQTGLFNAKAGVEGVVLLDQDTMGYGAMAGVFGNLSKITWGVGTLYAGENFIPSYYNRNYEYNKAHNKLSPLSVSATPTWGWFAQTGLALPPMLEVSVGLKSFTSFAELSPILSAEGSLDLPAIGGFSGLKVGLMYEQIRFNPDKGLFNKDTTLSLKFGYPVGGVMYTVYEITYDAEKDEFQHSMYIASKF